MSRSVYTGAGIRAIDAHTIQTLGVPGLALMEIAGRAVAAEIVTAHSDRAERGVVVVAGRGNNGGDGYVLARHLHLAGYPVSVVAADGEHSPDCAANRAAAEALGIPVSCSDAALAEAARAGGLAVDAVLGTGLSAPLRGLALERVRAVEAAGLPVVAVDMPTGLCGDTGRVLGRALRAVTTVTFEHPRVGQLLEPGADYVGRLVVAGIGLAGGPARPALSILDGAEVAALLPERPAGGHKGMSGHLGVVAGSPEKAGAAALVCAAALRAGAGLVTLLIGREALPRLAALRPEVMVRVVERATPAAVADFDALAVGPGRGVGPAAAAELVALWRDFEGPAVFDADGLTALVGVEASAHPRCITPHPGEAGRLLGRSAAEVQADRLGAVRALSRLAPALLKGRNTLICAGPSETPRLNPTGTRHLATAGSGDVLTGVVGALLARGLAPADALACGAFLHGVAGEVCGPGLIAGDLADALPRAAALIPDRGDGVCYRPLLSR